jgi:hypothetical protein
MREELTVEQVREMHREYNERTNQATPARRYVSKAEKSRFDGNHNLTTRYRINPDGSISRG